jgi:hypothetical protein
MQHFQEQVLAMVYWIKILAIFGYILAQSGLT